MKKTVLCFMLVLLSSCTCLNCEEEKAGTAKIVKADLAERQNLAMAETPMTVSNIAVPCSYSCLQAENCLQKPEPVILKPRVTEKMSQKKRRRCCPDEPVTAEADDKVYVPDAPEIYVISANRTMNSMQKEAAAFYSQAKKLKIYVAAAETKAQDLPGGVDKGTFIIKKRLKQMDNVSPVDNKQAADYVIATYVDWFDTASKKVPAVKYDLLLKDKGGEILGKWSEIVHQADGDRSWW